MKFRYFLFSLLCLPVCLSAQEESPYRTEFGLDLLWTIAVASGWDIQGTEVEIIYKENLPEGDLRFKLQVATGYRDLELINSFTFDSLRMVNYHQPGNSYGAALGFGFRSRNQSFSFYSGVDLTGSVSFGTTVVERCPTGEECVWVGGLENRDFHFGMVPFLGTKLNLSRRMFFTIEFGTALLFRFGERKYYRGEEVRSFRTDGPDFKLNRLLNDIAVSYRF
ncbi:MAG: hypothetical protein D6765_12295 [Bacteroidetes bacterium]|nr:MAG: hypothetical protein D6765_12295 [Bacteroidota bacterium]